MRHIRIVLTTVLYIGGVICYGQNPPIQPDNTKVNTRDRAAGAVTADQQKSNAADTKLTKTIRQSIMADKSLSSYAHNIKIISQNGAVTLKGPVKSDTERATVIAKAVAATGSADKVTDQISIKN
jgi:hyperosmotically inducible protein